jgi:hypothetical protein
MHLASALQNQGPLARRPRGAYKTTLTADGGLTIILEGEPRRAAGGR